LIKIAVVFGTRPEAIKLAPVVWELRKYPDRALMRVIVTSQHREMLDQMLAAFDISPDLDMDIMQEGQSLTYVTNEVLGRVSEYLEENRTDLVLVQGDTTTAFAAALAAFYRRVDVGHVEAGLRSRDLYDPFPEELNRHLIDVFAGYYFAPTENNRTNLLAEAVPDERIYVTGNTSIDTLLRTKGRLPLEPPDYFPYLDEGERLILMTAHRRESFGPALEGICRAVLKLVERNAGIHVVYPVHPNPNVKNIANRALGEHERIHLVPPADYYGFVRLMDAAYIIITDSGGIQEEAPSLGKPVLVIRNVTERTEAVEAGTVKLVGRHEDDIIREAEILLNDRDEYDRMARAINPYGDGHASERIVKIILDEYEH
jgi:UDP-N-acetylglucosamine 2-epimerase (non-hydrolysing)